MSKTKVDIVSGFLGAGKTTFIRKLLEEAIKDEQVVLIENEFGEIGIDGGFLKNSGIEIREMSQGCICCSLVGDFAKSLEEILTKYKPDRIIIEPSGVGKLSDVMKAIADVEEELGVENNSAVTVVDAKKCRLFTRNFGEFFNNQIQFANTIVLSRTDICDQEKTEEAVALIREINPTAQIITTPVKLLSGDRLLEILESPVDLKAEMLAELDDDDDECDDPECSCHHHHHDGDEEECHEHHHHHHHDDEDEEHEHHHHHHDDEDEEHEHHHHHHHHDDEEECDDPECACHHHDDDEEEHEHHHHDDGEECHEHHHHHHHHHHHDADEVFMSWGAESLPAISEEKLHGILEKLAQTEDYGKVIRAKGMLPSADNASDWLYFDLVPGEFEIRHDAPDYTGKACVIGAELKEELIDKEFR